MFVFIYKWLKNAVFRRPRAEPFHCDCRLRLSGRHYRYVLHYLLSTIYLHCTVPHCTALHCTALHCTALLYRIMHRPTYQPTALCMHLTRNDKLLLCMRACCYNTLCLLIVSSLHTALRVCLSVCLSGCLCVCVIRAGLHGSGGWANYMEVGGEDTAMLNATWNTIACKQRLDLTCVVLTRQLRRGNELS